MSYKDLLDSTNAPFGEEAGIQNSEMGSHISRAKVLEVVKKLFGGRAPGVNEVRPEVLKALDVDIAVVADTTLQHRVDIRGSAAGLADCDGGPSF